MTLSLFIVFLSIIGLIMAFMRYKRFIDRLHFNNELRKDKELLEMYNEYLELQSKYPNFNKKIGLIQNYVEKK